MMSLWLSFINLIPHLKINAKSVDRIVPNLTLVCSTVFGGANLSVYITPCGGWWWWAVYSSLVRLSARVSAKRKKRFAS